LLSKKAGQQGSAPMEFIMVALPIGLLLLSLIGFFRFSQGLIAQSQQLYEAARYMSLADIDQQLAEADLHQAQPGLIFSQKVRFGLCINQASEQLSFAGLFSFTISREVVCETG
jgi:hypothetical protein